MLLQSAVDLFRQSPELAVGLALLLRAALAWQRGLSWYEYRTIHGFKRAVFPVLDERLALVSFVNPKGGRDDPEFLRTVDGSVRQTVGDLRREGGTLHLINALKRRPDGTLTAAHVVWTHPDQTQTEAYLFDNGDGTVDVYAHYETSVTDPEGHLSDRQNDGDPLGVVTKALPEVA